jgi:uncharacterized protein
LRSQIFAAALRRFQRHSERVEARHGLTPQRHPLLLMIVLPDRVLSNWWRADGHRLVLADLDDVIEELPERLVVGTGVYGQMRPDPEALNELRQRGVEVEALPTDEAVRLWGA